jgi:DHA1 family bicyclomycin/chloramphenicol resistance-like MFS transporter
MNTSLLRNALILGLLSALGPFAIDMYLPALPAIGLDLHAGTREVQLSLMAFFLAIGACQLIYGPLSDMFGRKPPLYFGLVLFALGSIGCSLAPNIEWLIAFRLIEGIGACAGMVIPRAIVRDLHTGPEATRLMSMLMLVFSVSPILAPLAGSVIVSFASWRVIFWAVTGTAVLGIVLMVLWLHETRPAHERADSSLASAMAGYQLLLRDRHFLGLTFIGAFGMAGFFSYLANSSFVLIEHYGLSPAQYSGFFAANAASFIGVSQFNGRLSERLGLPRVIRFGVLGALVPALLLFIAFAAGVDSLVVLAPLVFVSFGFLGLVVPTTSVLALDEHGEIAGTASALLGTLQMVTGAVVMACIAPFVDGSAMPMVTGIAACMGIAFVLAQLTLKREPQPPARLTV